MGEYVLNEAVTVVLNVYFVLDLLNVNYVWDPVTNVVNVEHVRHFVEKKQGKKNLSAIDVNEY